MRCVWTSNFFKAQEPAPASMTLCCGIDQFTLLSESWVKPGFHMMCNGLRLDCEQSLFTGLPYDNPSRKVGGICLFNFFYFFYFFFRVGKSLACHSPAKWCLCA